MRIADYKRGEFILSRLQYYLLIDLGKGEINAEQAGDIFELLVWAKRNRQIFPNGITTDEDLAQNKYYLRALDDYRRYLEIKKEMLEAKYGSH